jgi:hypothetical protein
VGRPKPRPKKGANRGDGGNVLTSQEDDTRFDAELAELDAYLREIYHEWWEKRTSAIEAWEARWLTKFKSYANRSKAEKTRASLE